MFYLGKIDGHWLFGKEGQSLLRKPIGICWSGECCQQLLHMIGGQGANIPLGENCGFAGGLLGFKNEGLRIGKDNTAMVTALMMTFSSYRLLVFMMLV